MTTPTVPARFWGDRDPKDNYQGIRAESAVDNTAEIRLYDPIDSWGAPFGVSAKDFTAALDSLPGDTSTITLRINSPGGEVGDSLAILNALRAHKADVDVIVEGRACSGASVIAMAGKTITMARQSQMMIHDAAGIGIGNATEMADYAAFLEKSSDNIAGVYAERAGGTKDEWRAVMRAETWFNDDEAVAANLADKVAAKTTAPKAAMARFDLAVFNYAGREQAPEPHTPADQPVTPPTDHKEADTMSDTIPTAGLVKVLDLPADADEDAILEAVIFASTASAAAPEITLEAVATAYGLVPDQVKTALDGAKNGYASVPQVLLDSLKEGAESGKEALARQRREDRDRAISTAQAAGKIGRSKDEVDSWKSTWDRDAENTAKWISDLPVRFPVGDAPGVAGDENSRTTYTDDMAAEDAQFFGVPQEVLAR